VDDFTLADLQKLDAGYNFKDLNGEYSYRGKGVYIPSLEELFQRYGDMRLNIEIKDAYPINGESQIERKLWELIQKYHMEDKVLVVSFDQELVKRFDQFAKGRVALAGGKSEITKFVLFHKLFLNGLYHPQVDAVQIPTKESILDLTDAKLINGAHKRNMFVHYWTIDDEQTMRYLLDRGADGIITNRPDILMNVIKDYKR
jgi:glycerophosphoryl diester phosphodiesterase